MEVPTSRLPRGSTSCVRRGRRRVVTPVPAESNGPRTRSSIHSDRERGQHRNTSRRNVWQRLSSQRGNTRRVIRCPQHINPDSPTSSEHGNDSDLEQSMDSETEQHEEMVVSEAENVQIGNNSNVERDESERQTEINMNNSRVDSEVAALLRQQLLQQQQTQGQQQLQQQQQQLQQQTQHFQMLLEHLADRPRTSIQPHRIIKTYDGTTNYTTFKAQFEQIAKDEGWTEQDMGKYLNQSLIGSAIKTVEQLVKERIPITYHSLDTALTKRFAVIKTLAQARKDFLDLKQGETQSITDFAKEVEIAGKAYLPGDLADPYDTMQFVIAFSKGLRLTEDQEIFRYAEPSSLQDAVRLVLYSSGQRSL